MKKRLFSILASVIILIEASTVTFADSDLSCDANEITREEVLETRPEITPREATISMLLNAGWTTEEIDEWYTEEALLELDENAKAISNSTIYTVNHENTETGEVVSEQISRQQFDYGVNKVQCEKDEHINTELSTLSSNGILDLQPIYDFVDMDHITANDRIYFGTEGYSGASIWNADSDCYLKQNMGMVWMANDKYLIQYRFEWMTEPAYKLSDNFAVGLATDLIVHENPNDSFVLRYSLASSECTETSNNDTLVFASVTPTSMGQGRQVKINWPGTYALKATNLRGFLSFYAKINNRYTYQQFITYAQYYHGKLKIDTSADISFSISGTAPSFSISPSWCYITEDHPMEVRAYNPYTN